MVSAELLIQQASKTLNTCMHMLRSAGTAVESFAKLADSIYFYRPGHPLRDPSGGKGDRTIDAKLTSLYINQVRTTLLRA